MFEPLLRPLSQAIPPFNRSKTGQEGRGGQAAKGLEPEGSRDLAGLGRSPASAL